MYKKHNNKNSIKTKISYLIISHTCGFCALSSALTLFPLTSLTPALSSLLSLSLLSAPALSPLPALTPLFASFSPPHLSARTFFSLRATLSRRLPLSLSLSLSFSLFVASRRRRFVGCCLVLGVGRDGWIRGFLRFGFGLRCLVGWRCLTHDVCVCTLPCLAVAAFLPHVVALCRALFTAARVRACLRTPACAFCTVGCTPSVAFILLQRAHTPLRHSICRCLYNTRLRCCAFCDVVPHCCCCACLVLLVRLVILSDPLLLPSLSLSGARAAHAHARATRARAARIARARARIGRTDGRTDRKE